MGFYLNKLVIKKHIINTMEVSHENDLQEEEVLGEEVVEEVEHKSEEPSFDDIQKEEVVEEEESETVVVSNEQNSVIDHESINSDDGREESDEDDQTNLENVTQNELEGVEITVGGNLDVEKAIESDGENDFVDDVEVEENVNNSKNDSQENFSNDNVNTQEGDEKNMAAIFGESSDEELEDDDEGEKKQKIKKVVSDDESSSDESNKEETAETSEQKLPEIQNDANSEDSDPGVEQNDVSNSHKSDFDMIMEKKKKKKRRRDGGTNISDVDDIVNQMLNDMKVAADEDREAVEKRVPALSKLKILKRVVDHMKKQDMKESFIDMGVYSAISDWLTPIQGYTLPHMSIRTELLQVLHTYPTASAETLSSSKVGRAVMLIFKHPKEIRKNKELAGRLINKWSRPLFGLNENFRSMSKTEREERDQQQMSTKKRKHSETEATASAAESDAPLRPGEKGFVMRARVPMPSNRDYVVRPKWKVNSDQDEEGISSFHAKRSKLKKTDSRLDKHIKKFAEKQKKRKMQQACSISIEGNKMKF